jgi:hypothetical protein
MVEIPYRDIYNMFLMLWDVIPMLRPPRTHMAVAPC